MTTPHQLPSQRIEEARTTAIAQCKEAGLEANVGAGVGLYRGLEMAAKILDELHLKNTEFEGLTAKLEPESNECICGGQWFKSYKNGCPQHDPYLGHPSNY